MYRYRCEGCGATKDAYRKIDDRHFGPFCYHGRMELQIMPTSVQVFQPYKAVAVDKETGKCPVIKSIEEHRAFLQRNGYEEVGNDKSMAPPSYEEWKERQDEQRKDVGADYQLTNEDVCV
jgi:hypothetical protein